jgi:hypothetical protein
MWLESSFLILENTALKWVRGPNQEELMWERRKLHSEEIHSLNSSPNIAMVLKSRCLKWAGNVARFKKITKTRTIFVWKLRRRDLVGHTGLCRVIVLRWTKQLVWVGYWFTWQNAVPTFLVLSNWSNVWLLRSTKILFHCMTGWTMETMRDRRSYYRNILGFRYNSTPTVYLMPEQCQINSTAFTPTHLVYAHPREQFMVNIFQKCTKYFAGPSGHKFNLDTREIQMTLPTVHKLWFTDLVIRIIEFL